MINLTTAQKYALELCKIYKHTLIYGGSRSGKTTLLTYLMIIRALKYPRSRHVILRRRYSTAHKSIWSDTLRKLLDNFVGAFTVYESDHIIKFYNKSEIWVDGLDDKDRVEKILGREYSTIFFNEISEIPYDSITTALTRLSENIDGCSRRVYYDCNPTGTQHWANKIFLHHKDPITDNELKFFDEYGFLRINPSENPYLTSDYMQTLDSLPELKRKRFLFGEWVDPEGAIFTGWNIIDEIPMQIRERAKRSVGIDFGFSVDPATVIDCYLIGDDLYIDEILYSTGLINEQLLQVIDSANIRQVNIYADSAEAKTIEEFYRKGFNIRGARKGADSVRFGLDWLSSRKIHVTRQSQNVINELQNYRWATDRNGRSLSRPIDDYNHAIDAIRYACENWMVDRTPQIITI